MYLLTENAENDTIFIENINVSYVVLHMNGQNLMREIYKYGN